MSDEVRIDYAARALHDSRYGLGTWDAMTSDESYADTAQVYRDEVRIVLDAYAEGAEPLPALDPADVEMVADELRALGWTVTPPPEPEPPEFTHGSPLPPWLVERDDGDGFDMLGGGRDE